MTELEALQVPAVAITQKTKQQDRDIAFDELAAARAVLVQISVVSEGVDIPELRIWIDASPTLSPVKWLQMMGRVTRPGDTPRVLTTNRNLERHAYLLEGLLPTSKFKEAQEAFDAPSTRTGLRHLGLEALGRFKAVPVELKGGTVTYGYSIYERTDRLREFYALVLPTRAEMLYAYKESTEVDGKMKWGRWQRCQAPKVFAGYQSTRSGRGVSDAQRKWWEKQAASLGLRKECPETAKEFQVLPVLAHTGFRVEG